MKRTEKLRHTRWECKYRGIHSEVSQETYIRVGEKGIRSDHSGFGTAEGKQGGGGVFDG